MKQLLIILNFCISHTLFADNKLAIIIDPDGYTNVRSGPGTNYKVVDTLFTEDFFYFEPADMSGWSKVTAWKGKQIEGFVHKSKIQEVIKLSNDVQKNLIEKIIIRQNVLADNYQKASRSNDSLAIMNSIYELTYFTDVKYNHVLNMLPIYFCSTGDIEVIQLFMETVWKDISSANEMPPYSISICYICKTEIVLEQIALIKDKEHKKLIFDQIEWGLLNHLQVEGEITFNKEEFNKFKTSLDKARKKSGL